MAIPRRPPSRTIARAARRVAAAAALAALAAAPAVWAASAQAPTATTGTASAVSATSATLAGTVNPNGSATTYVFEYGPTSAYGSQTSSVSAGSGSSAVNAGASLSGLASNATYHFRIVATSAGGTADGADATFTTTASPPIVTTGAASSVTADSALLNGSINPNGKATSYAFQYGTSTAYGLQTATVSAGSGSSAVSVSATASGLASGTTYHYRLIATNADGTTDGPDRTLATTHVAPSATTGAPSIVSDRSAVLTASVAAAGKATTYAFQYGTTTGYGAQTAYAAAGSGSGSSRVGATIDGLQPGTLYHYRVVATSSGGTTVGGDATLVTTAGARPAGGVTPPVFNTAAEAISANGAQLDGALAPAASPTTWFFEYGLSTAYGARTAPQTLDGTGPHPINARLSGLESAATFHYRLVAQTGSTEYLGPDGTFTTKAPVRAAPAGLTLDATSTPAGASVRVVASGTLEAPAEVAGGCNGGVEIQVAHAPLTLALATASLNGRCGYRATLMVRRSLLRGVRRLTVHSDFTGNATLLPRAARSVSISVPPRRAR